MRLPYRAKFGSVEAKEMKNINRRESPRIEIRLRCHVSSPALWMQSAMYTENISRSGVLIAWRGDDTELPVPSIGQMVTVEIELPANHGFISSNPVVERPEIHIVDAQGNERELLGGIGNPHDRTLTVNAFLAEPVIGRQLYFDGDHPADRRNRKLRVVATPRNENAAATDIFRIHGALHPKRWRRHMAPEPDFDPRALTSINVLHFFCFDTAEFSSVGESHQCRK